MDLQDWKLKRQMVGVIALICWVLVGWMWFFETESELFFASSIRIGAVMTALWVAMPTKGRVAAWANMSGKWWFSFVLGLMAMVIRPRLSPVIIIILVVLRFLWKPKQKKRPTVSS